MGQMTRLQTPAGNTDAYLASARPSPGPPVLLLHSWWGLNKDMRNLADRIMGRVEASLDHLLALPDVRGDRAGIVALSFGGWYGSQVAAARSDVAAFVSIYSDVYEGPGGAAYLGHFAEDDQFVESPQAAGIDKPLPEGSAAHLYPGMKHWFTEPDRPEFDEDAAELVYARTVAFLRENLG